MLLKGDVILKCSFLIIGCLGVITMLLSRVFIEVEVSVTSMLELFRDWCSAVAAPVHQVFSLLFTDLLHSGRNSLVLLFMDGMQSIKFIKE